LSIELTTSVERLPLKEPFHISGFTFIDFGVLVVTLRERGHVGRGEGLGVYYREDNPPAMRSQIEALRPVIEQGISREMLLTLLPPGGARNALDCALWDLEARREGLPVWQLAGLRPPRPLVTTFTLSADDPDVVAAKARALTGARAIKVKLTSDDRNVERLRAVRSVHPDTWLMVDGNQGFTPASLDAVLPAFVEAQVQVIEQPFPVGREAWLDDLMSPITIAADESVQDHRDLEHLAGRVQMINIKLDKCGGLTEGLRLVEEARRLGFALMVGNMGGTSWSMAPAFMLGSLCQVVDLDGPLYISADRSPAVSYRDGQIWCPDSVWGGPATIVA
jgi:L-alanine-DL-glutamate epimerase-like enolase superfamily enzyme